MDYMGKSPILLIIHDTEHHVYDLIYSSSDLLVFNIAGCDFW